MILKKLLRKTIEAANKSAKQMYGNKIVRSTDNEAHSTSTGSETSFIITTDRKSC